MHETASALFCSCSHSLHLCAVECRNGLHDMCFRSSPEPIRVARAMSLYACWAPEPDNVPPWAEYIDGYWYCNACWKWLDYKHVETGQHIKRVEYWYWRQAHSAAVLAARSAAQSAEAGPSAAGFAAEMAVSKCVHRQDLAELHAFLHDNQRLTAGPSSSASTAHKTAPTLPSPSPLPEF